MISVYGDVTTGQGGDAQLPGRSRSPPSGAPVHRPAARRELLLAPREFGGG